MRDIGAYLKDYDAFHRTKGNKICHLFGIPVIVLSALGMLDRIVFVQWDFPVHASPALVLWALGNLFYIYLHVGLGLTMVLSTGLLYLAGAMLPMPVLVTLQVVGWIVQFIGHSVWEKKKPAFVKNLVHLMIGPAYIQNYLLGIYPLKR